MKICVVGTGYVGLVTGACLANMGHEVICVDNNEPRIATLKRGIMPFYEPGLSKMVCKSVKSRNLHFTNDLLYGVKKSEIIFIAVGTPGMKDGRADISAVIKVGTGIAEAIKSDRNKQWLIVNKSTVPVGTGDILDKNLRDNNISSKNYAIVSNPEFLREGSAISDFMRPDRIIIGTQDKKTFKIMAKLYSPIKARILFTSIKSAELIKYVANAFLATKISFINEIANACAKLGTDVTEIAYGIGLDKRIGPSFLKAGLGYGGGCLPKDIVALIHLLRECDCEPRILRAVDDVNKYQSGYFISKIISYLKNKKRNKIAILGIAFKPGTDDFRNAPSKAIINKLIEQGAKIRVYDPVINQEINKIFPEVKVCKNGYEVVKGADALVIVTEWPEFTKMNFVKIRSLMRAPVIFDGRNLLDPLKIKKLGFTYVGIGR